VTPKQRLSYAIAAILAAHPARFALAETAPDAPASLSEIGEIIVTAQRREESIQNVPITIQALTGEALTQLSVTTFNDFVKYLPNVTMSGTGPPRRLPARRRTSRAGMADRSIGVRCSDCPCGAQRESGQHIESHHDKEQP
jgi:iron complex outermembrane receptor protein